VEAKHAVSAARDRKTRMNNDFVIVYPHYRFVSQEWRGRISLTLVSESSDGAGKVPAFG
jgi:hypothetical protein